MPKINSIHWRKLVKVFERNGWVLDRIEGDHLVYVKSGYIRPVVIPKVKEVQVFIIANNLKTAKILREEYFKLCADFSLGSDMQIDSKGATRPTPIFLGDNFSINENWQHQKGAVCFDRKIDKDLYPILKNQKI